jgi:signal transduction histidine kinase/response regulator RpfG family c-di-GMP phosphodiesterase
MAKADKPILVLEVHTENDVVLARQRSRLIAGLLGFTHQDQSRIGTAVSEIARNAFNYAHGGRVQFGLDGEDRQALVVTVRDQGPGMANLDTILGGQYVSSTGLGLGIVGAKRLMDEFEIQSAPGKGTTVRLRKLLPSGAPALTPSSLARIADELARAVRENPLEEIQQQNRELLQALEELRARQAELAQLNHELEDTNRGVVALYAELDERADYLQRASELKTRFLSNMSHEFRTPLNAILSLSGLVLSRADGDLTPEQEKQVNFIRKSAEDLSQLVNDLLDLARAEAGKIVVRAGEFDVATLFSALRGMLRPLLAGAGVDLVFEPTDGLPAMYTDEAKVSQILRNFISNALKFTERGEVRVSAKLSEDRRGVIFSVADTGIGIAPDDQERIFEEWTQVENPLQRKVKGTGLGLPLSRKLAELLGGHVFLKSELGVGSTFYAVVPVRYTGATEAVLVEVELPAIQPGKLPVLAVEDNKEVLLIYESYLRGTPYQLIGAANLSEARRLVQHLQPVLVILDILLKEENAWAFLAELKSNAATRAIPVLVATVVDSRHKARALGADEFLLKPVERAALLKALEKHTARARTETILMIDDEAASRYSLKRLLAGIGLSAVVEATNAKDGFTLARQLRPRAIFLDLVMPEVNGYELLAQLRADPVTAPIPVIVNTSKKLTEKERELLAVGTVAVVFKESASQEKAQAAIRAALARAGIGALPEGANAT